MDNNLKLVKNKYKKITINNYNLFKIFNNNFNWKIKIKIKINKNNKYKKI